MSSRFLKRPAALVVWLVAVTVSSAWLSDVLFQDEGDPASDYMWQPLEIDDGLRVALGLAATAVTVGIAVLLMRWFARGALPRGWVAAFIAGGAVAAYAGVTYTVATTPVIGANIGGGLLLLLAGPFILATVIGAIAIARSGRRTPAT